MNTDKHRYKKDRERGVGTRHFLFLSVFICVHLWIIILSSCTTKPSDLRTLVPAETLVYLETNDLAAALQPIVDSKPFREVAKSKPDFSALKGVQVAVAVTGFETSEVAVTDEQAVGKVQPRFVAVADTHAWNYQAVAFAEKKLGSFVTEIYDAEPKLEKLDAKGGKYFTWTSQDGRKAFALVIDSLIYFGNDESAIDKALSVRTGQTDSIAKTGKLPPPVPGNLASGYVSTDGVAQIAALAGLHFASQASDEEKIQSAVAGILPQLIRGTVTDITWSTSQTSEGIEDKWSVTMPTEAANVFSETMMPSGSPDISLLRLLPSSLPTITVYDLKNPQTAWRSLRLAAGKQTDPTSARILESSSSLFFEPYGVEDAEMFLSAVGPTIVTAKLEGDHDSVIVVATVTNKERLLKSLESILRPKVVSHANGRYNIWQSDDGELSAFTEETSIILSDTASLLNCCVFDHGPPSPNPAYAKLQTSSGYSSKTISIETSVTPIVDLFAEAKTEGGKIPSISFTETRFTKTGMERRTVSDLGFIGWMIAQLAAE